MSFILSFYHFFLAFVLKEKLSLLCTQKSAKGNDELSLLDAIFFIENSERESLFPLALCSLESAALHNPQKPVLLLRSTSGPTLWTPEVSTLVTNYQNIRFQRHRCP